MRFYLIETPDGVIKRDPRTYRDETSFTEGEYDRNTDIVFVSLNAVNPDGLATDAEIQQRINRIIDHEMIHALRNKDLINEQEYQYLRQEVKRRKVPESVDATAFNNKETYYARSKRINTQVEQTQRGKDYQEEIYVEEAIAELYRNRFSQPAIPKKAETIFEKITQFFKSLGQAFRRSGFDKSSDIFRAIEEGEVGKRQRGEIRTLREIDRVPLADELQPIVEIDETRPRTPYTTKEDASDGTIATTVKTSTNSFYRDLKPGAVKGVLVKGKVGSSIEDTSVLYDIRKLSREEIAADRELILKEFAGKDSIEITEWLSKNGPGKDYQLIAERIHKQLKKFKDKTGFDYKFNFYTGAGDARPGYDRRYLGAKRRRILGVSMYPQPEYDNGKTFRIYINNTETNGVDFNTILHELVHAATQAGTLFAGYQGRTGFDKSTLVKATEKLERIRSKLKTEIRKRKKAGENVDFYTEYGTKNIDELLAVGFTDREFQQFMESVEFAPKSKTLWESFVDAIRQILGLPAKAGTVFSEFLKEGARYLQFTTQEINQIGNYLGRFESALEPLSTPVAAVSRPQDLPSFSRKSLDDEINKLGTQIYNLERRAEADRQYLSNDAYNQDMRRIGNLKARQEDLIRQRAELPPEQPPLFSREQDIGSPLNEPLSYRLNDRTLERWLKYHNYENLNERPGAPRTEGEIDAAYRRNDPALNESYVLYPDRVETCIAPTGDKLSKKTYKNPTHRQLLVDFDYIPRTQKADISKRFESYDGDVPTFSRAQLKVEPIRRVDQINMDADEVSNIAEFARRSRIAYNKKLKTIPLDLVNKYPKLRELSLKNLRKLLNKNGNLVVYRSLNLSENEEIINNGQLPDDPFASTTLDSKYAQTIGKDIAVQNVIDTKLINRLYKDNKISESDYKVLTTQSLDMFDRMDKDAVITKLRNEGIELIRKFERPINVLRYEIPLDRVILHMPIIPSIIKNDLKEVADQMNSEGGGTIEPDYNDYVQDGMTEEQIEDGEIEYENDLLSYNSEIDSLTSEIEDGLLNMEEESEVIANLDGITPTYIYKPTSGELEFKDTFRRGKRFAKESNTSENKKLVEATERVEEIVKSTPNGEIPPVNPNASDVAFKAFLDFNDTSNTSTPPDDIPTFSVGAIPEEYQDQVDKIHYTEPRKSVGRKND